MADLSFSSVRFEFIGRSAGRSSGRFGVGRCAVSLVLAGHFSLADCFFWAGPALIFRATSKCFCRRIWLSTFGHPVSVASLGRRGHTMAIQLWATRSSRRDSDQAHCFLGRIIAAVKDSWLTIPKSSRSRWAACISQLLRRHQDRRESGHLRAASSLGFHGAIKTDVNLQSLSR